MARESARAKEARTAQIVNALAPEVAAAVAAAAATWFLPAPATAARGEARQRSLVLDLGWPAKLMPTEAAARLNQPEGRR